MTQIDQMPIILQRSDGQPIARFDTISILGLLMEAKVSNRLMVLKPMPEERAFYFISFANIRDVIADSDNLTGGLGESNLMTLYDAFLKIRVYYVATVLKCNETRPR